MTRSCHIEKHFRKRFIMLQPVSSCTFCFDEFSQNVNLMSMYCNQSLAVWLPCRDSFWCWSRCLILLIALAELTSSADFFLAIKSWYRARASWSSKAGVPVIASSSALASFTSGALASTWRSGAGTPRALERIRVLSYTNEEMISHGSCDSFTSKNLLNCSWCKNQFQKFI